MRFCRASPASVATPSHATLKKHPLPFVNVVNTEQSTLADTIAVGWIKDLLTGTHRLRLRLLGPAQVTAGEPPTSVDLAAVKGAALLFYLAARPDQTVTRTRLITLLWEESDEQEGRN